MEPLEEPEDKARCIPIQVQRGQPKAGVGLDDLVLFNVLSNLSYFDFMTLVLATHICRFLLHAIHHYLA